ncbi:MAG: hypothetical protein ACRDFT_03980 [bacterium]
MRVATASVLVALLGGPARAQGVPPINLYRFILGVDVPESPAFVAMGVAPTHVLKGSAPKPITASLLDALPSSSRSTPGVSLDVTPYFLVGGGVRDLARYRSGSIAGRLTRVLTKTLLSVGAAGLPDDPGSPLVGFAVRSTLHDPHDPVLNSRLPEEIAAELAREDVPAAHPTEEDVTDRGVDLSAVYARARSAMRARSGDAQVSGGWGMMARARGGVLDDDSLGGMRHTLWLSAQYTFGRRFDILATVQLRNAFHATDRLWVGAALLRKTTMADVHAELYYDTQSGDLHPGLAVDARASAHLGIVASLSAQPDAPALVGTRRLQFRALVRWFAASDRPVP